MFNYIESGLKISIEADFCFKYDDNYYVKKNHLKKCDYVVLLKNDKGENFLSFIEVKRINFFPDNKDRHSIYNKIQDIIKKFRDTFSFIGLFDFKKNSDRNLEKASYFLYKKTPIVFILILNDYQKSLKAEKLMIIKEVLKKQIKYLKIKKLIIISSKTNHILSSYIKIAPFE